ncbi:response regulator transcription factor [Ferrovum sp. PN-J185]|uniref:response regulator transcription factor n=1 Tax=Ferrovum sp. PN-J185 TaxID=1356306 RepID=UPI00079C4C14|nr:response regulator transcription factor [Ferrovum sp. PN-J185]KXW55250.1 transcriptional regulatory protein OmpR [Ferrovum sp. PN-J185]MCC6068065.1 response regulator transcription factor [Ferrovum sp. PN-J185]
MDTNLTIALIEDNQDLRELIACGLRTQGYSVFEADCAEAFDELSAKNHFDLLILDLNLPGEDGLSIALRTKDVNPNLFIIMLTARRTEKDRINGYNQGADIYLSKPISQDELLATIKTIERRIKSRVFSKDQIILDVRKMFLKGKEVINLNQEETATLKSLAESESHRLPYFRLLEVTGKEVDDRSKSTLEVQITRLRKKLIEAGALPDCLKAIRGEGYQLTVSIKVI